MKKGYKGAIEPLALENSNFRTVLYTAENCQLVLMSLKPGEEIGLEVHRGGDQFFRFESGQGRVVINGADYEVKGGDGVIVPAGAKHNVTNISASEDLKLYTIYSPPHHRDGVIHETKADAVADKEHFGGRTTEQD